MANLTKGRVVVCLFLRFFCRKCVPQTNPLTTGKSKYFPIFGKSGESTHKKIPSMLPLCECKGEQDPLFPLPPPPMWWDFETRNSLSLLFLPEQLQGFFLTHAAFANKQSLNQLWEKNGGRRGRREKKREKWISLGKCLACREEKTRAKYEDFPLLEFKKS